MKILVAVDDDRVREDVLAALHWCVRVRPGDTVSVLHETGMRAWEHCIGDTTAAFDACLPVLKEHGRTIVAEAVGRLSKWGIAAEGVCLDDDPAPGILRFAHERKPDLIVLGARGREERGFLVGSVSQKVKALGETNVLIVRRGAPYDRARFRALLAVDGSLASQHAVDVFLGTVRVDQADVCILHALDLHSQAILDVMGDETDDVDLSGLPDCLRTRAGSALSSTLSALSHHGVSATPEVRRGRAAEEILRAAGRHDSDLIVVGARGLGRLHGLLVGSVTQQVVRHALTSVLVARSRTDASESVDGSIPA